MSLSNQIACSLLFTIILFIVMAPFAASVGLHDDWRVYSADHQNANWQDVSLPSSTLNRCVPVPEDMQLCHGIGYDYMRLPNMLQHETTIEAVNQATHWNMLKRTNCHSELSIFLCSLYAPVCVREFPDKEILPCRSLCEAVKSGCLPVMRRYGYEWPEIANCTQFPGPTNPMCIRNRELPDSNCKACKLEEEVTFEFIGSSFCLYSLVFKASIKEVHQVKSANGDIERVVEFKRLRHRAFLRSDGLDRLKQFAIRIGRLRPDANSMCKCHWLDAHIDRNDKFLIMGEWNHVTGEVDIKFVHKWLNSRKGAFRKSIRHIRKSMRGSIPNICSNEILPTKIGQRGGVMMVEKPKISRRRGEKKMRRNRKSRPQQRNERFRNQERRRKKVRNSKQRRRGGKNLAKKRRKNPTGNKKRLLLVYETKEKNDHMQDAAVSKTSRRATSLSKSSSPSFKKKMYYE